MTDFSHCYRNIVILITIELRDELLYTGPNQQRRNILPNITDRFYFCETLDCPGTLSRFFVKHLLKLLNLLLIPIQYLVSSDFHRPAGEIPNSSTTDLQVSKYSINNSGSCTFFRAGAIGFLLTLKHLAATLANVLTTWGPT